MSDKVELHGAKTGNCFRAAIALEEAAIVYQVHRVDLAGGQHRSPEHLRLNPAGKVPTLVDLSAQGKPFVLSQSSAILLWAEARAPGRLAPQAEGPDRAVVFERFFYFVTDVIAPSHAAFALRRRGADAKAAELLDVLALEALSAARRFVSDASFMGGDRFSMADIAAFTIASAYEARIDWETAPALERWYRSIAERPAVRRGLTAFD